MAVDCHFSLGYTKLCFAKLINIIFFFKKENVTNLPVPASVVVTSGVVVIALVVVDLGVVETVTVVFIEETLAKK